MAGNIKDETGLCMKYFVLKPAGESLYAEASRLSLYAYAREIRSLNPTLADDIVKWVDLEVVKCHRENHQT